MKTTHKEIRVAAQVFKKALEQTGKVDVVVIYSYRGKSEDGSIDVIYSSHIADNFMQVLATCDLVKHDLLNGGE